jgi:hypothetical protein
LRREKRDWKRYERRQSISLRRTKSNITCKTRNSRNNSFIKSILKKYSSSHHAKFMPSPGCLRPFRFPEVLQGLGGLR